MKTKSVKVNFLMNIILSMSSFVFPLITFPYVSRILLPEGMGKINFATSVISYFVMFAQLGIPTYGIRVCAQVRDDKEKLSKVVHELLFMNLLVSFVVYILFFGAVFYVPRFQNEKTLFLAMSITILLNVIGCEWLYKALEKYTYITMRSLVFKIVALVAMFLLVHEPKDYVIYGIISIFASAASNVLNFYNLRKYIIFKRIPNYDFRQHIKPIFVFFMMSCSVTIYTNLDTIMLGFLGTDADVGYYSSAVKIKMILTTIVASLGTVLLPRTSYYWENGKEREFYAVCKRAVKFVIIMAIPLMIYFLIMAHEGILFLAGDAYEAAVLPMRIMMFTLLPIGLGNIIGIQMLVPMGKEKQVLKAEVLGAIVDFGLNLFLIPLWGPTGAAVSNLVAEVCVTSSLYLSLKKSSKIKMFELMNLGKVSCAIGIASLGILIYRYVSDGSLIITLIITAMIFFGAYASMLLMLKEEECVKIASELFEKIKKARKG